MFEFKIESIQEAPFLKRVQGPGHNKNLSHEDLVTFFHSHKNIINDIVNQGMGIYFQNFPITSPKEFGKILKAINPNLVPYTGAKVRNSLNDKEDEYNFLYSPTSTPSFRKNFLHNEMAYKKKIPRKIALYCQEQAPKGGESILGDQREVYKSLSKQTRQRFENKKLKFVRFLINRRDHHDFLSKYFDIMSIFPSWQNNFQTESREVVEQKCREDGYKVTWTKKGDLLISTVISPTQIHPTSNENIWLNNAHVFQLHKDVFGIVLYLIFKVFFLVTRAPKTTSYYGDGTKLESKVVKEILKATNDNEYPILLNPGDFIYANNHTISHGRRPFKGSRKLFFTLLE